MIKLPIIFYDFETGSKFCETTQPTQLSAVVINPKTLTIEGDFFNSYIKPIFDVDECRKYGLDPLEQEALNITNIKVEDLEKAPDLESVWAQFVDFTKQFNYKGGKWNAPIRAGYNNQRFDDIIINRIAGGHRRHIPKVSRKFINSVKKDFKDVELLEKDAILELLESLAIKEPWGFGPWDSDFCQDEVFHPIHNIDLMRIIWYWMENKYEVTSISMDSMREYFGMQSRGAHNALVDVTQGAEMLIRCLRLSRHIAPEIGFEGSFKVKNERNDEFNKLIAKMMKQI